MKTNICITALLVLLAIIGLSQVAVAQPAEPDKQYDKALKTLNLSPAEYPASYQNRMTVGDSLTKAGHRQQAIEFYSAMLDERPGNADVLLKRGIIYSWEKQYDRAEADLRTVIDNHPTYSDAYQALTDVYRRTDRNKKALETVNRWIHNQPERTDAYLHKARVLADIGQQKQARHAIEQAENQGASQSDVNDVRARLYRPSTPDEFKWSVSLKHSVTTLSRGFSNWQEPEIRVKRSLEKGSIAVGSQRIRRFDNWNTSVYVDIYYDLWENTYGNFRYLTSPQHDFLPRNDILGEVYKSLGDGWEVSAGFRRMEFNNTETDILRGSLSKYTGNWYLSGRVSASENNRNEDGFSQKLIVRNYYRGNADDYWEISGGWGESQVITDNDPTSETLDSETLGVQWQRFWTPHWGTKLGFSYRGPEVDANRRKVSFEVEHRW